MSSTILFNLNFPHKFETSRKKRLNEICLTEYGILVIRSQVSNFRANIDKLGIHPARGN